MITVVCDCGERVKVTVENAKALLRREGRFAFGSHVSDPKAFVMRWMVTARGWIYGGGRIAKTTLTMTCPECRARHLRSEIRDFSSD